MQFKTKLILSGILVFLFLFSIVVIGYNKEQEYREKILDNKVERNNYIELLLGLNAEARQPTERDIIKGYVKKGEETYVLFESRELKDYGWTSYWRIN